MITPSYYPIIGGTETAVQTLTIKLNERGIYSDVITFNMNKKWEPTYKWKIEKTNGFNLIKIPALKTPRLKLFSKYIKPLSLLRVNVIPHLSIIRLLKNYDIIHFNDEVDLSFPLFSYFVKKPKIFHYHTLFMTYPNFYKKYILPRYILRIISHHHICNAEESLKLLVNLGIDKEKITIIPNYIDLKNFSPYIFSEEELYRYENDLNINHKTKKIVYVSRLDSDKLNAIINTINSAKKIVKVIDAQIIIVGTGSRFGEVTNLAKKINKQLNRKAIILTGFVNDLKKIFNMADVVIGVGRVALEAMACGKPVIVVGSVLGPFDGNFGDIVTKDNVYDLKNYNFSGRNSSEIANSNKIADAVIKLLTDEKYRYSLGNFNRWFVEKEYDIQKITKQIELIYCKVLENYKKG